MKDLLSLVIKTSTLAFRDFLFHFMRAYLPEKKNKKPLDYFFEPVLIFAA